MQLVYNEEIGYHRAPIGSTEQAVGIIGPAILFFGSEGQKRQHLPPITAGETVWCQGFSEPEAGSGLASLRCRAVKDGDDYVINGDKIWTSNAHRSDWCALLAFASLVPRLRNSVGDLHGQHLFFTPVRTDAWITVDYEVS